MRRSLRCLDTREATSEGDVAENFTNAPPSLIRGTMERMRKFSGEVGVRAVGI